MSIDLSNLTVYSCINNGNCKCVHLNFTESEFCINNQRKTFAYISLLREANMPDTLLDPRNAYMFDMLCNTLNISRQSVEQKAESLTDVIYIQPCKLTIECHVVDGKVECSVHGQTECNCNTNPPQ